MAKDNTSAQINRLYDFVLAVAASGTTIADYLDLCEQLWCSQDDRPWVAVALARKCSLASEEPDVACTEFLSQKVHEALTLGEMGDMPTVHDIGRFLPTIIQMMSGDVWTEPSDLWRRLVDAVADEFGVRPPEMPGTKTVVTGDRTTGLVSLFSNAIGSPWTPVLNEQLESWRDAPDYIWLLALRDAGTLDAMLGAAQQELSEARLLDQARLLEHMRALPPYDRRRFLVLHNLTTGEDNLAEPAVDSKTATITWEFKIPIEGTANVQLTVGGRIMGNISLARTPVGHITVQKTTGLCQALVPAPDTTLVVKRAAASRDEGRSRLTAKMEGVLEAVPDGALLKLVWRSEGGES